MVVFLCLTALWDPYCPFPAYTPPPATFTCPTPPLHHPTPHPHHTFHCHTFPCAFLPVFYLHSVLTILVPDYLITTLAHCVATYNSRGWCWGTHTVDYRFGNDQQVHCSWYCVAPLFTLFAVLRYLHHANISSSPTLQNIVLSPEHSMFGPPEFIFFLHVARMDDERAARSLRARCRCATARAATTFDVSVGP